MSIISVLGEEFVPLRKALSLISCRYTKTTILKPQVVERLVSKGVEFAEVEDCTTAVLRIACDRSINGMANGRLSTGD